MAIERAQFERGSPDTVRIAGEIDVSNADSIAQELAEAIRSGANGHLRIDLSELSFIDSTGIHMLVKVAKAQPHVRLTLASPMPTVGRILEICGLPRDGDGYSIGPMGEATVAGSD